MRIASIFSSLAVGLLIAADKPPTQQEELKRLGGTWNMFDMEINGSGFGRTEVKRIVFEGNKYQFYSEMNKAPEATFTLNPAANPRTIDVTQSGKMILGIYRFHEGRLEICLADLDKPRPSVFATQGEPGIGRTLYILKPKNPPANLDPVEATFQAELKKLTGNWTATSREIGGRPDKDPKNHGLLVDDGKWSQLFKGNEKDTYHILRLDPTSDPPQIDFRTGSKRWVGIYRLSEDKLEICMGTTSTGKRPTVFNTKAVPGAGNSYIIYQKDKK